jgi:hypothetical protein
LRRKQCCIDWKALEEGCKVQVGSALVASGGCGNNYSQIDNIAQRLEGRRLSRVLEPLEMEVGQVHCVWRG